MSQFAKDWQKREAPSFGEAVRESIRGQEPLKPRLEQAVRRINVQVGKLDTTISRLKEKDSSLFNKVVIAVQKHDNQMGSALSSELAEVRKMAKMVSQSKIALEHISLKLGTVKEIGDVAHTLAPVMGIMTSVRSGLGRAMPEAEHEIGEIGTMLSSMLVDAGQLSGLTLNFGTANEDAERILAEASTVAEERIKERFPELPIAQSTQE